MAGASELRDSAEDEDSCAARDLAGALPEVFAGAPATALPWASPWVGLADVDASLPAGLALPLVVPVDFAGVFVVRDAALVVLAGDFADDLDVVADAGAGTSCASVGGNTPKEADCPKYVLLANTRTGTIMYLPCTVTVVALSCTPSSCSG